MEIKDRIATVVGAASLYGAFAFGAQRLAYERFYEKFGLSPEDVGIDATLVLQQTAAGLAFVTIWYLVIMALYVAVVMRISGPPDRKRFVPISLVVLSLVALFASVYVFVLNYSEADDAAVCAAKQNGQPVRTLRVGLPVSKIRFTRLGIRADLARVRSTDPNVPRVWKHRTVLYLGSANSTAFVYDRAKKRTFRIPASSVISIDTKAPRFRASEGCKRVA